MEMPDYPALARDAGDAIEVRVIDGAGHFDFVEAPESDAFIAERQAVLKLMDNVTKGSGWGLKEPSTSSFRSGRYRR